MRHRRFDWHERIKAAEREYWAARIAVGRLSAEVARDVSVLGSGPSPRDFRSADENLEGTYLVRMFAEFETGVRAYWSTIRPRARGVSAEVLLARVGDRCGIPVNLIQDAHTVRMFRNKLLHERDRDVEAVTVADAASPGDLPRPPADRVGGLNRDYRRGFSRVFSNPRVVIEAPIRERDEPRLQLWRSYKEHLSQAFARFFMRVGLPTPVTKTW